MTGVYSVDTTQASSVYALLGDVLQDAGGVLHCYSRLPIRQLLRYVDSNTATMWWISEHVTDRSVAPTTTAILGHFNRYMPGPSDVVVLEGLDWMVTREDESAVLRLIQTIDGFCRSNQFTVLLPTNALAYGAAFWTRLRSIAPPHPTIPEDVVAAVPSASEPSESIDSEHLQNQTDDADERSSQLVHLVTIPSVGFTSTILSKRMLQWKRMGFDLSDLEPALSLSDMGQAHELYRATESNVTLAIDMIRLMEVNRNKLSVTEQELFHYRLMSLLDVNTIQDELLGLLSTR